VHGDAGSVTIPIVLRLGELPDTETLAIEKERARCIRMIQGCIPGSRRQDLLDDLENLPCKGARDYQIFARLIYDTAWKIWAEDQKDYQYWENGWGSYLLAGAEYTKKAGDLSFFLLVGYATSGLTPSVSYGVSTLASEFKDQAFEFYSYYVFHKDTKDFQTCIIDFVNERFTEFLTALATGAVDVVILQGIDIRNPKTYKRFAWLWLWKFGWHLKHDPEAGLFNAMIAASKDVFQVSGYLLLQQFVNTYGNSNLKDLYKSVEKKGYLGTEHAGAKEEHVEKSPGEEKSLKKGSEKTKREEDTIGKRQLEGKPQKGPSEEPQKGPSEEPRKNPNEQLTGEAFKKSLKETPGLGGEQAKNDLFNHRNPEGQMPYNREKKRPMTFNEALEYHGLNKPKDTPFTSTTSSPEVVKRFNQDQIAQIDIPEHALRELLSGQKAARVPYEKYGDRGSKYLSDREWVFTKIPKENWKISQDRN